MKKLLAAALCLALILGLAACGGGATPKVDYSGYSISDYQKVDYDSKDIVYQLVSEEGGRFVAFMNLYADSALKATQVYGGDFEDVIYYGYWSELENGDLELHDILGWEDPDEILEMEMEDYIANKTDNGFTCEWKTHAYTVKTYLMDCAISSDGTIKYPSRDELKAKLDAAAAEAGSDRSSGGGDNGGNDEPTGNEIFSSDKCTTNDGMSMVFYDDGTYRVLYNGDRAVGNGTWTTENGLSITDGSGHDYPCSVELLGSTYTVNYGDNSFEVSASNVPNEAPAGGEELAEVFASDECTTFAALEMKFYDNGTFKILYNGNREIGSGTWTTENGLTIADGTENNYPCSVTLDGGVYTVNYGDNSFSVSEANVK